MQEAIDVWWGDPSLKEPVNSAVPASSCTGSGSEATTAISAVRNVCLDSHSLQMEK